MKREVAEKITSCMRRMDNLLEELGSLSRAIEDEEQRKRIRRTIGELITCGHEGITLEAVREYPDLHPDKDDL